MIKSKVLLFFVYFIFLSSFLSNIAFAVGVIVFNNTKSTIKVKEERLQNTPTSGQEVGPGELLVFQDYAQNEQIGFYAKATFLGWEYKKLLFGFQYYWYSLSKLCSFDYNILVVLFPAHEEGYFGKKYTDRF